MQMGNGPSLTAGTERAMHQFYLKAKNCGSASARPVATAIEKTIAAAVAAVAALGLCMTSSPVVASARAQSICNAADVV